MLDEQQNVEPQIEQIDEVEAEIETKSSGMPLWVWIAGGAVLITALVLIICGAKGVFGSKSTSKKPSNPKADGERRASAAQANNDISAAPVKGEPKKKDDVDQQLDTSGFAVSDLYATNTGRAVSGVTLATLFGIYKYFAGETVVIEEEPSVDGTTCVDENDAVVVCGSVTLPYTPVPPTDFEQEVADCEEAATGTCGVTDAPTDVPPVGPGVVVYTAATVAAVAVLGGLYVFWRKYYSEETAVVDDEDDASVATHETDATEHTTDDDDTHHTPSVVVTVDTPTDGVDEPVVVDPIHLDAETYVVVQGHLYKVPANGANDALVRADGVEVEDGDSVAYAAGQDYLLPHAHFDVQEEGETGPVTTTYVVQDVVSTVVKSGGMSGSSGNSTRVNTVHALPLDSAGQLILATEEVPMATFPFADVCQNQIKRETETIQ